jgi:hypothetical protein
MESLPFELVDLILQYVKLEDIARVGRVCKCLRAATECTFKWRGKEMIASPEPSLVIDCMTHGRTFKAAADQLRALAARAYLYAKVPPDHDEYRMGNYEWSDSPDPNVHLANMSIPVDYSALPVDEPFTYFGIDFGVCRRSGRHPFLYDGAPTKVPMSIGLLEALLDNVIPWMHQLYDVRRHEIIRLAGGWELGSISDLEAPQSAEKWLGKNVLKALGDGRLDMLEAKPLSGIPPEMTARYIRAIQTRVEANVRIAMFERYMELREKKAKEKSY